MKRKIKITSKQVKRIVLIVLLVAVVGLLSYLTISSFNKNHVSSNSTVPNESVVSGEYKKYEYIDENITASTQNAWKTVWKDQKEGLINRAYKIDYESTVPAEYTKDNKAHCYLWISVK